MRWHSQFLKGLETGSSLKKCPWNFSEHKRRPAILYCPCGKQTQTPPHAFKWRDGNEAFSDLCDRLALAGHVVGDRDMGSLKEEWGTSANANAVLSVATNKDSVVICCGDGLELKEWLPGRGMCNPHLEFVNVNARVTALTFTSCGCFILTAAEDGFLRKYTAKGGGLVFDKNVGVGALCTIAVSGDAAVSVDGGHVFTSGVGGVLMKLSLEGGAIDADFKPDAASSTAALAVSTCGGFILAAAADGHIRKYDAKSGELIFDTDVGVGDVGVGALHAIAVSVDGGHVFTSGAGGRLMKLSLEGGAIDADFKLDAASSTAALAVSTCGGFILAAAADGHIRKYDTKSGELIFDTDVGVGALHAIAVSVDGRHVFTSSAGGGLMKLSSEKGVALSILRTMPEDWLNTAIVSCGSLFVKVDREISRAVKGQQWNSRAGLLRRLGYLCRHVSEASREDYGKEPLPFACPICLPIGDSKKFNLVFCQKCGSVKGSTETCGECRADAPAGVKDPTDTSLQEFYDARGEHMSAKSAKTNKFAFDKGVQAASKMTAMIMSKSKKKPLNRKEVVDQQTAFFNGVATFLSQSQQSAIVMNLIHPLNASGLSKEDLAKYDLSNSIVTATIIANGLRGGNSSLYPSTVDPTGILPLPAVALNGSKIQVSIDSAKTGKPPNGTRTEWNSYKSTSASSYEPPTNLADIRRYVTVTKVKDGNNAMNANHVNSAMLAFTFVCKNAEEAKNAVIVHVASAIVRLWKVSWSAAIDHLRKIQLYSLQNHLQLDYASNLTNINVQNPHTQPRKRQRKKSSPTAAIGTEESLAALLASNFIVDDVYRVLENYGLNHIGAVHFMLYTDTPQNLEIRGQLGRYLSSLMVAVPTILSSNENREPVQPVAITKAISITPIRKKIAGSLSVSEAIVLVVGLVAGGGSSAGTKEVHAQRADDVHTFDNNVMSTFGLEVRIVAFGPNSAFLALIATMIARAEYSKQNNAESSANTFRHHPSMGVSKHLCVIVRRDGLNGNADDDGLEKLSLELEADANDPACNSHTVAAMQLRALVARYATRVRQSYQDYPVLAAAVVAHGGNVDQYVADIQVSSYWPTAEDAALTAHVCQISVQFIDASTKVSKTYISLSNDGGRCDRGVIHTVNHIMVDDKLYFFGTAPRETQNVLLSQDKNDQTVQLVPLQTARSQSGGDMVVMEEVRDLVDPYRVDKSAAFNMAYKARKTFLSSIHSFTDSFHPAIGNVNLNPSTPKTTELLKALLVPPGALQAVLPSSNALVQTEHGLQEFELRPGEEPDADDLQRSFSRSEKQFLWTNKSNLASIMSNITKYCQEDHTGVAIAAVLETRDSFKTRSEGTGDSFLHEGTFQSVALFSEANIHLGNTAAEATPTGVLHYVSDNTALTVMNATAVKAAVLEMKDANLAFVVAAGPTTALFDVLSFTECTTAGHPWIPSRALLAKVDDVIAKCDQIAVGNEGASKAPRRQSKRQRLQTRTLSLLYRRPNSGGLPKHRSFSKAASFAAAK